MQQVDTLNLAWIDVAKTIGKKHRDFLALRLKYIQAALVNLKDNDFNKIEEITGYVKPIETEDEENGVKQIHYSWQVSLNDEEIDHNFLENIMAKKMDFKNLSLTCKNELSFVKVAMEEIMDMIATGVGSHFTVSATGYSLNMNVCLGGQVIKG